MNGLDEFARRSDAYKARAEALDAAMEKSRTINGLHNLLTFVTIVLGLIVLWFNPTIRWAIGEIVALVLLRWIGNVTILVKFTNPTMGRINRDFPAPEPLTHSRSGRPLPGSGTPRIP